VSKAYPLVSVWRRDEEAWCQPMLDSQSTTRCKGTVPLPCQNEG
jgi:hypothetical protein